VYWYRSQDDDAPPLDPRWLDLAIRINHLGLVHAVGWRGNPAAEAFVQGEFDSAFKKAKTPDQIRDAVTVMVHLGHPKATDALIAAYEKIIGKPKDYAFWCCHLIPGLPKSAIPRLEEVLPKLKDREADEWLEAIERLRAKD
jgi:hypothetical protein